jgi:hypothetical protein
MTEHEPPRTVEEVEATTVALLGKQGPFRADVRLLERDGKKWVAKDYRACTPLYRVTVGAWNLRRERGALDRLRDVEGVPHVEAMAGRWILVMSHFPGRDIGKTDRASQSAEFFEEFARMLTGSTDPLDWKASFGSLGEMDHFNADFPNGLPAGCHPGAPEVTGIHYYSWTGNIVGLFGIRISTNLLDVTDSLLNAASLFYGLFEDNDGFVTVCSAQFGDVIGDDYLMNHVDTVNPIVGLVSPLDTSAAQLYRDHVHRLLGLAQ